MLLKEGGCVQLRISRDICCYQSLRFYSSDSVRFSARGYISYNPIFAPCTCALKECAVCAARVARMHVILNRYRLVLSTHVRFREVRFFVFAPFRQIFSFSEVRGQRASHVSDALTCKLGYNNL